MFSKKDHTSEEENVAKQGIRKIDRVVTGLLLGGIIASIYGVKKIHDKHEQGKQQNQEENEKFLGEPPPKSKQGIFSRIIFGNK